MSEIILSIITPTYNRTGEELKGTYQSICEAVKGLEWEWVLILHNNETVTEEELFEEFDRDPHVRMFEKKDGIRWACPPRNEGIRRSRGRYIYFLDDDDRVFPDFFPAAIRKMEADQCDILISRIGHTYESEDMFLVNVSLLFPEAKNGYMIPDDPELKGHLLFGACNFLGSKIISGKLIRDNHIFFNEEIKIDEDMLFGLECYVKAKKICVMSELTSYTYIQRKDSALQKILSENSYPVEIYTKPLDMIIPLALKNNISPSAFIWNMMAMFGAVYARGGMEAQKKEYLYSYVQKYIPYLNMDFPKWVSEKTIRKEYIVDCRIEKTVLEDRLQALMDQYHISTENMKNGCLPLYYKDISALDDKKMLSFTRGFWNVLEADGYDINIGAFLTGNDKMWIMLNMDKKLYEQIGADLIKQSLCYGV